VIPGLPHHITQRGNRRQQTFFSDADYALYVALMGKSCSRYDVQIWAWCLMPNHSHMIAVPSTPDALRRAIGEAHQAYTSEINHREGWQGHLWQGRFFSFVMDEAHTWTAARYIELNPVSAGLVTHAEDYLWSSARAHVRGVSDALCCATSPFDRVGDWRRFLGTVPETEIANEIRKHSTTGRPLGSDEFVDELERQLGRPLRPGKRGRKPAAANDDVELVVPGMTKLARRIA
jgi:putative transposase